MSRRIVYLFAVATCATLAAPAGADPECFDGVCRMPEVMEAPQASAQAVDEPSPAKPEPQPQVLEQLRSGPAPEPTRPQMRVDDLPRPALRPLPQRPVEKEVTAEKPVEKPAAKPVHQIARPAPRAIEPLRPVEQARVVEEPSEPVEVVSRRYEPPQTVYAPRPHVVQPAAGVVVVAPGAQYGEDGVVVANGRQDASWQLCQNDRAGSGHNRCIQYNYQPYGAYGYRPLGTYRAYRSSPSYVYVPDAKIITLD